METYPQGVSVWVIEWGRTGYFLRVLKSDPFGPNHGGLDGKESACNAGDLGLIPVLGISPGGGYSNPLQYSCLENLHGQRSLVGYHPWGHKESDMTERLSTHTHTEFICCLFQFNFAWPQSRLWSVSHVEIPRGLTSLPSCRIILPHQAVVNHLLLYPL